MASELSAEQRMEFAVRDMLDAAATYAECKRVQDEHMAQRQGGYGLMLPRDREKDDAENVFNLALKEYVAAALASSKGGA